MKLIDESSGPKNELAWAINKFFSLIIWTYKLVSIIKFKRLIVFIVWFYILTLIIEPIRKHFGLHLHTQYLVLGCASLALSATLLTFHFLSRSAGKLGGTSWLKRTRLAGTGEEHASAVVKQLKRFAADSSRKFGQRLGRDGVRIRRTKSGRGEILIPWSKFFAGFMLVGKSGSGKSSGILYPLLEETLDLKPSMLMIADAKGDYTQMLFKREKRDGFESTPDNQIDRKVYLLNPADRDSIQFKLEIRTSTEATKLAEIFIRSSENNNNPYFVDTARNVFAGILLGLHQIGKLEWSALLDVVSADSPDVLRDILALTPEGRLTLSDISADAPEQSTGILSTMKKEIKFLAPIVRAWEKPSFSVREFVKKGDGIILLRFHKPNSELTSKMIQIFFEMALCEIAPLEDYNANTYILFADELQNFPKLDLPYSTSFLRSKCMAHILSHQDVNRMQKIYGKEDYNSVFENIESLVILNSGTETAEWFSKSFGDRRVLQESKSKSESMGQGVSFGNSESHSIKDERTINYGRIIDLPVPIQTGKVTGLFKTAGIDVSELTWEQNITKLKPVYKDFIEAKWIQL